jgi:DNA invertase Pin-like site-specific DNA recombinase
MKKTSTPDNARAVIYCRVSTSEQVENHSLPMQERACREYCLRNGFEVARIFVEEGESAKTADRTMLNELMGFASDRANCISHVVVYSIDRFARNALDFLGLRSTLKARGIRLRSVTQDFDDSSEGRMMEAVLAIMAQFDNDKRADRTKAGMQAIVECGGYPFHAPLGYRPDQKPYGGRSLPILKLDSERAPLIRRAFELVAAGTSKAEARRTVTALGLRTLRGKPVPPQTFNMMLKKSIYCGRIELWDKDVRGDFEAVIGEELFDRVQAILRVNVGGAAGPHSRQHPDFPLRHFVQCSHCAKPLTGSHTTGRTQRYPYYHCRTRGCKARSYPVAAVEDEFRRFIEQLQPKPDIVSAVCQAAIATWKKTRAAEEEDKAVIKRRLSELNGRKAQVRESLIYRREITKQDYEEEMQRITSEIVTAEMQLEHSTTTAMDLDAIVSFAEHFLNNAGSMWAESSPEMKLKIQHALFPTGVHFDGEAFGTSRTNLVFSELAPILEPIEGMVAHTGFEPVLPP